jgi:hypothetical protein
MIDWTAAGEGTELVRLHRLSWGSALHCSIHTAIDTVTSEGDLYGSPKTAE